MRPRYQLRARLFGPITHRQVSQTIRQYAAVAADPAASAEDVRALMSTLVHSIGGSLVLVVILVLNIYKPRGMTRYGWNKQRKERMAAEAGRSQREASEA